MSHKSARKSHTHYAASTEEKEKRPAESPVKEMKKKIAANAEKEKQATDKTVTSPERSEKTTDKVIEKPQNEKVDSKKVHNAEKADKNAPTPDKNAQKPEKNVEKPDKNTEKDKTAEKPDKKTDKVPDKKVDKPAEKKNDSENKDEGKDKPEKGKTNGAANGDANGTDTVSEPDSSEEDLLVIDDQDEVFPELTYDDSDVDYEEGGVPSRSFTRRSQVKATKTPETPRPASVKEDDSKEKLLKMNDSLATDRKLRSADSPKPESKRPAETKKATDSPKKDNTIDLTEEDSEKKETEQKKDETVKNKEGNEKNGQGIEEVKEVTKKLGAGKNQLEMEVVVEVEGIEESRSRTRVRVSPYSRPLDRTTSSLLANYTGNNTTMEMDITETSVLEEPSLEDSSYLRGLRSIRGRTSYKPLKELSLKHTFNRSTRSNTSAVNTSVNEPGRPTGTVVGRKRKPDAEDIELGREASEDVSSASDQLLYAHSKRMRLFDRFSVPFRGFNTRRAAEIVGINTDLPLTAPVASTSTFDPETLKPSPSDPVAVPLPTPAQDRDNKRCLIM